MALTLTPPVSAAGEPAEAPAVPDAVRRRLSPLAPPDPRSWLWTGLVAVVAAVLRLIGVTHPRGKIFDEIYYATDAHNLLKYGVEWDDKTNGPAFVVHPPLGKWAIALGERLFGYNELGWRIASVVAGVAAVVIITRLARRMFGSTVLGCAAGLLMALDGMEFVLSRTALLDIFLMAFLVASFAALVLDRDQRRRRWLHALEAGMDPRRQRPAFAMPWWRLASAVLLGCALAVKWSAVWYVLVYLFLIVVWEFGLRRAVGVRRPARDTFIDEIGWVVLYPVVALAVYLGSWTGWFLSDNGWDRHWLRQHGKSEKPVIGALYNLYQYHRDALAFHTGLESSHPYQSWPAQWLLLGRPVAFYWSDAGPCGAKQCASEVLLLGTPLLWWSFIAALVGVLWLGITRRDWRAWPILLGATAGIAPWQLFGHRTMFYFYSLPSEPFLILAVVFVLGAIIGGREASRERRRTGTVIAAVYVGLVAVNFAYFYPIYTGDVISHASWWARMWLGNRWV